MTGMGDDGAEAMARLHALGGRTIAEAEETAVVWGMPGELVEGRWRRLDAAAAANRASNCSNWCHCMPLIRKHVDKPASGRARPGAGRFARRARQPTSAGLRRAPPRTSPRRCHALAQALAHESDPRVREAIFTGLARIATAESALAVAALSAVGRREPAHRRARRPARDAGGREPSSAATARRPRCRRAPAGLRSRPRTCRDAGRHAGCARCSKPNLRPTSARRRWRCWPRSADARRCRPLRAAPRAFPTTPSSPSHQGGRRPHPRRIRRRPVAESA